MARARKSDNRAKRRSKSATKSAGARRTPPDVERAILELAQRVAAIAAEATPEATSLRAALAHLLATHASHGMALLDAWKRARADKRAALALGWAREQLRLAIVELLGREAKAGRLRADPHDALAWVVVVASESAVVEAPTNAGDRIDTLMAVLGADTSGG